MSEPSTSRFRQALRTPVGVAASLGLAAIVVLAIVAPVLWSDDAARIDILAASQGASRAHPLGTDALGRDILYRVLVATRLSVTLALLAAGLGAIIGIPLGAVPTLVGGRIGRSVSGFINLSVAFPTLLVAIFVAAVVGVGARGAVAGIGIALAPYFARLSQTLSASVAGSDYLAAARMLGVRRDRLLRRHILPNIAEPLLITTTIAAGDALLALAGLSFLGLGVQPPRYDWGRMLSEGLDRIYVTPIVALGPAIAITLGALSFVLFGEVLAKAAAGGGIVGWKRSELRVVPPPAEPTAGDGGGIPVADVLAVENLTVSFPGGSVPVRAVSLEVAPGEIVGIVGESGSGKTLTAMAIADLLPAAAQMTTARYTLFGQDPRTLGDSQRRRLLGRSLAVVYQDPMSALNPALRVGRQLAEVSEVHDGLSKIVRNAAGRRPPRLRPHRQSRCARAPVPARVLGRDAPARRDRDGPDERAEADHRRRADDRPRRHRAAADPAAAARGQHLRRLGGDRDLTRRGSRFAAVQARARDVRGPDRRGARRRDARRRTGPSVHRGARRLGADDGVRSHAATREHSRARAVPVRRVAGLPVRSTLPARIEPLPGLDAAPRAALRDPPRRLLASAPARRSRFGWGRGRGRGRVTTLAASALTVRFGQGERGLTAVDRVDLELPEGATVGLVGESGSGKSTLARALSGLVPIAAGEVLVDGAPVPKRHGGRAVDRRRRVQMIFQDPFGSLNPRMTVGEAIGEAAGAGRGGARRGARREQVRHYLELVHLDPELARRYPSRLSGGQRQRVAIARSLAARPEVLIADEITSSLDVSVQSAVLNLMRELRGELGISMMFVSHNLATVRYLSDHLAVMYLGRIVEIGPTETVVSDPRHPYTRHCCAPCRVSGPRR